MIFQADARMLLAPSSEISIYSSFATTLAFHILSKHALKEKFGKIALPGSDSNIDPILH